jgi:citrate synthase
VAYLLIYGELPTHQELSKWRDDLSQHAFVHEKMARLFEHFPLNSHPMGVLTALVASMSTFYPDGRDDETIQVNVRRLLGQVRTIAAYAYKQSIGQPIVYPKRRLGYCANFLRMMYGTPAEDYDVPEVLESALNMLLIVHADHEQNCSTSTVRMVGSSQANLFTSISAGVSALWGPLHGGANQAVIEMLQQIQDDGADYKKYINLAKDKDSGFRLMGFGHRVYKNFDPRAQILKKACDNVLEELGVSDPLLDIAKHLEQVALEDEFFVERQLYPNVDFYSGIIYRAMGIPIDMFTVMFAIGRMPGWIAHWLEMKDEGGRIHRPRQIYTGPNARVLDR